MGTKRVVELLEITEVPDDHIECSICGLYREPKSFKNEGQKYQSRTNCSICYNMKTELMREAGEITERIKSSSKRKNIERKLSRENLYLDMSLTKEELIDMLKKLPDGARIVITQTGYYSDCELADLYDEPEKIEDIDITNGDGEVFYSIGHSSQDY